MEPVSCKVDKEEYVLPDLLTTGFSDLAFDMTPWEHPTHVVRPLPNGLLDVSDTPHHLSHTVHRNETASPLLRLPGEIRNKIYSYVYCTGVEINMHKRKRGDTHAFNCRSDFKPTRHEQKINDDKLPRRPTRGVPSNFQSPVHLPLVCRRIYAETAVLLFSSGHLDFKLETPECFAALQKWLAERSDAQRNAIQRLTLRVEMMWIYTTRDYLPRYVELPPMGDILPNLRHLHVKIALTVPNSYKLEGKVREKENVNGIGLEITRYAVGSRSTEYVIFQGSDSRD